MVKNSLLKKEESKKEKKIKNKLRTIMAQIVQKLKNNEPQPTVLTHMVQLTYIRKMQTTWILFRSTWVTFGIKITVSGELRKIDVERTLTPLNSKARNSLRSPLS